MSSDAAKLKPQIKTDEIEFSSLIDRVTISRDDRGIPFIEATNEADLYFAQGYATATDRLWQMDFLRRTARGELAEIFGPPALELDKLHRVYGFRRIAETLFERARAQTRRVLDSYARGVNAFIEQCGTEALPLEFRVLSYQAREWSAIDSLALGKLFAENLSFTIDADILRALLSDLPSERVAWLLPETSPLDLAAAQFVKYAGGRSFSENEIAILTNVLQATRRARAALSGDGEVGSNSWVVSGERSLSGKPMLASDPHLAPTSPSIWHIVHLAAGELRVAGVSVPGVPGVMIGHNESIAWGITNLCPDVQDLYFENIDADVKVRREEIAVRNSPEKSVTMDVKVTCHGPVIFETGSIGLALRWTALDADVIDLETFLALNRARDWDDFVAALSGYGGPPQNFTYADTAGHIGYYTAGRIPVRKTGDGSLPYDGTTDEGDWISFVPFAEMPHVFDPPAGFIVQANQRLVDQDYPYHLTHNWRVPYRARRIYNLLQTKPKLDLEDFLEIQSDTYSYPDALFAGEVVKLGEPAELIEQLAGWDGYSNADSTVLPLVTEMRKAFRRHILESVIGAERAQLYEWRNEGTFVDRLITERPGEWLPKGFNSYESLLLACYQEARNALSNKLGPDPKNWTWGQLAPVRFQHPLEKLGPEGARFATAILPQNSGGSMPAVNAGSRVSMRFVADLSDWDATRLCLPLGESGDPVSPHRTDQLEEWRNVAPSILPFSENAIARTTRNVLLMTPC
jgi:penicillin amidase